MVMKTQIDAFLKARNLVGYAYTIFVDGQRVVAAEGDGGWPVRGSMDSSATITPWFVRKLPVAPNTLRPWRWFGCSTGPD
jgi:hypothetical protein